MSRPIALKMMSTLFASALVLAAGCTRDNPTNTAPVGTGGSGSGPADPNSHTPCTTNADCGGGQICTTIGCCPGCHSDADCAADSTCVAGNPNFCAPKSTGSGSTPSPSVIDNNPIASAPTPNSFGPTTCLGDSDCPSGELCTAALCQVACTPGSCATGQQCVAGRCYVSGGSTCGDAAEVLCANDAQCGTGRSCVSGQCHAQCSTSASCGIGESCGSGGTCVASAPSPAQCTFDSDCGTAFRCINATCHALCGSDSQCGAANLCDHGVCRANNRPQG
jgi:hypothetical protein